ncbi:MAG: PAS domain-containing protein [Bacteroidales bacterium]|jgi:PAS domain S-box-containing protein|nr:PAS domain-containing protein [Bacteroidales bacterium]
MGSLQQHIKQLEEENRSLKEQLAQRSETNKSVADYRKQMDVLGANLPDGCLFRFEIDPKTSRMGFTYVTGNWVNISGLSVEEAGDFEKVISGIHPDDRQCVQDAIRKSIDTQCEFNIEFRFYQAACRLIWVHISSRPRFEGDMILCDGYILNITHRKNTELALLAEKERLEALGDNFPNGTLFRFEMDVQTGKMRFTYLSGTWFATVNVREEDALSDMFSVLSKIHPDDFPRILLAINESATSLNDFNIEVRYLYTPDTLKWMQISSRPRAVQGKVLSDGFIMDITDRKTTEIELDNYRRDLEKLVKERTEELEASMEELTSTNEELISTNEELQRYRNQLEQMVEAKTRELVASRERLLTLSNNLPGGVIYQIMSTGDFDKFTYISASFATLFQLSIEEALADINNFARMIHPDDKHQFVYFDPLKKVDIQFRVVLKSKKQVWIHMRATTTHIGNHVYLWDGFMIDITERKKTEEALAQSEEMYRQLTVASPDAVIMCTTDRKLQYISPKAVELFGIDPEKNMSEIDIKNYVHPHEHLAARNVFDGFMRDKVSFISQILLVREDRSEFFGEISAATVKNKSGKPVSILMVIRDITDRKKSETELIRAKEKAEESDNLKSAFLANMSHEIRTPINGIVGFLGFLADDHLSPKRKREYINIINNNSIQLVKLIDDIIDIAKIEAKQINIQPVPFKPNEFMYELKTFFETYLHSIQKEKIAVILDDSGFIDHCVTYIDSMRLRQVLNNLIGNAVKFTEKGYICFGYRAAENNKLEFFVEDTGCGLPRNQQDVIFERFRQANLNNNRQYGGTGLGLAISKSFVQMMGGDIAVQSELNEGSTFSFTVSYIPVGQEEMRVLEKRPDPEQTDRRHVALVVESDMMKRRYYELLLAHAGVSSLLAGDLRQWTDHLSRSNRIDMVLVAYAVFKESERDEAFNQIKTIRAGLPLTLIVPDNEDNYPPVALIREPVTCKSIRELIKRLGIKDG